MLFGCKLSLAMVSISVSLRSSDCLPSGGTSVVAVAVVVVFGAVVDGAIVTSGALNVSPLAQAASPKTMLILISKRFTSARL